MEDTYISPEDVVYALSSNNDASRKMGVFKLQSCIGDPSFAELFILHGGLEALKELVLNTTGNTLAYSLSSYSKLLEVDKGWESVDQPLLERIVGLVATNPLVTILRGAMSTLVMILSHAQSSDALDDKTSFRIHTLTPAIASNTQFLEMLVSRLSSADNLLSANALQLINSLMRDAIATDHDGEWPELVKQIQDLGVVPSVYSLMQGTEQHELAQPLLEFQSLTKVLFRRWKQVPLDPSNLEHRRALKTLHLCSDPPNPDASTTSLNNINGNTNNDSDSGRSIQGNSTKYRRLGFETENPHWDFQDVGLLGMMDLLNYVRKFQNEFQKTLADQGMKPVHQRCPVARASLAVTTALYDRFEIDKSGIDDSTFNSFESTSSNMDSLYKPLLLHWPRLHVAGLRAYFRLWKTLNADIGDINKVTELIHVLMETVIGESTRTTDIQEVEDTMADFDVQRLRDIQMQLIESSHEDIWGTHFVQLRGELRQEAVQFIKEQRIQCLLRGAWFPVYDPAFLASIKDQKKDKPQMPQISDVLGYRFVQLSHNRRYLHYADFEAIEPQPPLFENLRERVSLHRISSVVSNITATPDNSSSTTVKDIPMTVPPHLKITINGFKPTQDAMAASVPGTSPPPSVVNKKKRHPSEYNGQKPKHEETAFLTLHPLSQNLASEWFDGLLMLLNQNPVTNETTRLIDTVSELGLKIRLLNVRYDDAIIMDAPPEVPSREGLDDNYYYDIAGNA